MKKILNIYYWENIWWIEKNIEFLSIIFNELKFKTYFLYYSNKKNNLKLKWTIKSLNENIKSNILIKFFRPIKRAYNIKQYCKQNNINYSISHWDSVNISNILSKIMFWNNSIIIITINNSLEIYKNYFLWKIILFLLKILYKKSNQIICISKEMKNEMFLYLDINKKKITTIHNPININDIQEKKKRSLWKYKKIFTNWKITFLHIARLSKIKHQSIIIENFYNYYKNNSNSQLIIIWEWKEKNNLSNKIKNLKADKNIIIIWYQDNIYNFLGNSDYFLFNSGSEWFWRSLIEANACWVPILTHDFKYWAKEIIRNNNNFSKCNKIEIHQNWILVPYLNNTNYLKGIEILTKTNFNKEIIIKNSKFYDIKNISKLWDDILKKI